MTIKALIEELKQFDENLPIFVRTGTLVYEEVRICGTQSAQKMHIFFEIPRPDCH